MDLLLVLCLVLNDFPPAHLKFALQVSYLLLQPTILVDEIIDPGAGLLLSSLMLEDQAIYLLGLRLILYVTLVDHVAEVLALQLMLVLVVVDLFVLDQYLFL